MRNDFDPYGSNLNGMSQPAQKKSWGWPLLLMVVGGPLIVILLFCGGGLGIMMFGMNVLSAEIEMELRDHPQFREHIGEVQSFDVDWAKSFAEEGDDVFVYDVQGTKGSGEVTVESVTNDVGKEEIISAQLRMSSGEVIELNIQ